MENLIDFDSYPIRTSLKRLLVDKSTKKNIIWATNSYHHLGSEFDSKRQIEAKVFASGFKLEARVKKCQDTQLARTKNKAEVFTPSWLVNQMNNYHDQDWFSKKEVFNREREKSWGPIYKKVEFKNPDDWKAYVQEKVLEITCGEAPFLVSRYDASTGEEIKPTIMRMGILDRKLRLVNENTETKEDWISWAIKAVQASYGYEYQGDSLLIARINILMTFVEYFEERWNQPVDKAIILKLANIISWNIWQMDGLTDTTPFGSPIESIQQMNFYDFIDKKDEEEIETIPCRIFDWKANKSVRFSALKETKMKKFDFIIGNPPYQDEMIGDSTQSPPVYHLFADEASKISDKVMLITPARFLFNAGATPKKWNLKMLNNKHFKVLNYIQKSSEVFPNTDIKGGVTVFYLDNTNEFEPVEVFTPFEVLNSLVKKMHSINYEPLTNIMCGQNQYKFSEKLHEDYKDIENKLSKGHKYDLTTSIFEKLPEIFLDEAENKEDFIKIIGRLNGKRVFKWIRREYIAANENLLVYKVILPSANGSGAIGEVLSTPLIGEPLIGYTQTFSSIGFFKSLEEAENCMKYIKTKFARVLLGILKITQHNPPEKWKYVPLQDFTSNSDIDWSKSIAEIDQQLYKKYDLNDEEISFIEKNVQEMV